MYYVWREIERYGERERDKEKKKKGSILFLV